MDAAVKYRPFIEVLPYAAWMALMLLLPATAQAYAARSLVCAALLLPAALAGWRAVRSSGAPELARRAALGVAAGVLVWIAWVAPECSAWYRRWLVLGAAGAAPSPYEPAVCGWWLTLARLAGSAFVIPAAEELFFRRWLLRWLGADRMAFLWMVVLFAVEHNRPAAAAFAGAVYGVLALRRGIGCAIIAHSATNLALGVQVIVAKDWAFW